MSKAKPCPFCGSDYYLTIHVDRLRVSSVSCDCGASVSIDCSRCSDPTVGMLVDGLVAMWNKRWCAVELAEDYRESRRGLPRRERMWQNEEEG